MESPLQVRARQGQFEQDIRKLECEGQQEVERKAQQKCLEDQNPVDLAKGGLPVAPRSSDSLKKDVEKCCRHEVPQVELTPFDKQNGNPLGGKAMEGTEQRCITMLTLKHTSNLLSAHILAQVLVAMAPVFSRKKSPQRKENKTNKTKSVQCTNA